MTRNLPHILLAVGIATGLPSHALGQGTWRFIDRDLSSRDGELTQVSGGRVTYVDRSGRVRESTMDGLLAMVHLLPPPERPPRELPWIARQLRNLQPSRLAGGEDEGPSVGTLELTDGQVWSGLMLSAEGESVTWLVEDAVPLSTPIDTIRSATITGPIDRAREAWTGVDDRLVLANGDVLDGYVASLGPDVTIEIDGRPRTVPLERVAGYLLANPAAQSGGVRIRTTAGSVIAAESVTVSVSGDVSANVLNASTSEPLVLSADDVRSILLHPAAAAPLATLDGVTVSAPVRSSESPVTGKMRSISDDSLGFDDIELSGPIRVTWALPRDAARFATSVSLPPAMWAWGDCEVVVLDAQDRELARHRVHADEPAAEINVPLGGQRGLTIEVLPGPTGPVQDQVVLHAPTLAWR